MIEWWWALVAFWLGGVVVQATVTRTSYGGWGWWVMLLAWPLPAYWYWRGS